MTYKISEDVNQNFYDRFVLRYKNLKDAADHRYFLNVSYRFLTDVSLDSNFKSKISTHLKRSMINEKIISLIALQVTLQKSVGILIFGNFIAHISKC